MASSAHTIFHRPEKTKIFSKKIRLPYGVSAILTSEHLPQDNEGYATLAEALFTNQEHTIKPPVSISFKRQSDSYPESKNFEREKLYLASNLFSCAGDERKSEIALIEAESEAKAYLNSKEDIDPRGMMAEAKKTTPQKPKSYSKRVRVNNEDFELYGLPNPIDTPDRIATIVSSLEMAADNWNPRSTYPIRNLSSPDKKVTKYDYYGIASTLCDVLVRINYPDSVVNYEIVSQKARKLHPSNIKLPFFKPNLPLDQPSIYDDFIPTTLPTIEEDERDEHGMRLI